MRKEVKVLFFVAHRLAGWVAHWVLICCSIVCRGNTVMRMSCYWSTCFMVIACWRMLTLKDTRAICCYNGYGYAVEDVHFFRKRFCVWWCSRHSRKRKRVYTPIALDGTYAFFVNSRKPLLGMGKPILTLSRCCSQRTQMSMESTNHMHPNKL